MTTIKDVARLARVSIASASYALNETGTISADTRKRVLAAAEQLNYHPNAFARNLKKPKTRTIGVFITRFGGSFYEEILEGIHEEVLKTAYELIVCPDSRTKRKILTYRQVDGAIVFDTRVSSDIIARLASKVFPIVVLDRLLDSEYVLPLLVDNRQGVIEAFHHLYDQGARKISFISGAMDSVDNEERKDAFLGEARKKNLDIPVYNGNFTEKSGYEIAEGIISGGMVPEAVFCANDQMAIGFIEAMQEHQLKVPDDIAVVGFDDIPLARYVQPSLTTIGASRFMWGSTAASQLIGFLEDGTPFKPIRMPTKLIIRASSVRSRPFPAHRS
jgi:LacI family transcriptional regulator